MPLELLEIVDEGLYSLVLWCASCGHLAIDTVEDARLEDLDRHLDATCAQMAVTAELLAAGAEPAGQPG